MANFEYTEEHEDPTGVGADIFIRKRKPGPTVGVGYFVDIYENGVKINSIEAEDKKEVKEILDEYKNKYNTMRSFEVESQQHVTYKTKEERGEFPPLDTGNKEEEKEEEEREETAMQPIDNILLKKASQIENLLYRLQEPTIPIKKRAEDAVESGSTDFIPETPPTEEAGAAEEVTEQTAANQMIKEWVIFIKDNAAAPLDDLYNGVKKWMSKVKKKIKDWERMAETYNTGKDRTVIAAKKLDKALMAQLIKNIVTSGDPSLIKEEVGIELTPEEAALLQKVSLMEIGSAQDQGVLAETINKAATSSNKIENAVSKIMGEVSRASENEAVYEAASALKEVFNREVPELTEMLPDNYSGKAIQQAILEMEQDAMNKTDTMDPSSVNPVSMNPSVEIHIKSFWNYAKNLKKTAALNTIFTNWMNKENIEFDVAQKVLNNVHATVNDIFRNKSALTGVPSLLDILVTDSNNNVMYDTEIKVGERGMLGKTLIADPKFGDDRISNDFDKLFRYETQAESSPLKVPEKYTNAEAENFINFISNATNAIKAIVVTQMKDRLPGLYNIIVTSLSHEVNAKTRISFTDYDGSSAVFFAYWKDSALSIVAQEDMEESPELD